MSLEFEGFVLLYIGLWWSVLKGFDKVLYKVWGLLGVDNKVGRVVKFVPAGCLLSD